VQHDDCDLIAEGTETMQALIVGRDIAGIGALA
jgi:hypothetical protein